jgi:hypothetical protein
MDRHKAGTRVIPILVDAVDAELAPFKPLQPLPKDTHPIRGLRPAEQEAAWAAIAGQLVAIARTLPPAS